MDGELVIYVDILLFVNVLVNGALLWVTCRLLGFRPEPGRMIPAVGLSAGYGLLVCIPAFSFAGTVVAKIAAGLLIVRIAFRKKTWRGYLKQVCVFLAVSFGYMGILLLLQQWTPLAQVLYTRNGEFYYNIPVPYVLGAALVLTGVPYLVRRLRPPPEEGSGVHLCRVLLFERETEVLCYLDSGNFLKETVSGLPVVVLEKSAVLPLLPEHLRDVDMLSTDFVAFLGGRFRIVPFKGVGGSGGVMAGFTPDGFFVGRRACSVVVAVSVSPLESEGHYGGILNRELILK